MTTLISQTTSSKGIVEIVSYYDASYNGIYIDGELITTTEDGFITELISRKVIKQCVAHSGVSDDALVFMYVDFESYGRKVLTDYDANDYLGDYAATLAVVQTHGPIPSQGGRVQCIATGIDALEEEAASWR